MDKEKETRFIDRLYKAELLPVYLVSLVSSDELVSVKACETSLEKLEAMDACIMDSEIPLEDRKKYAELVKQGIEICKRDMELLKAKTNKGKR